MHTLIFLRHGKTEYTNNFPDLTVVGESEAVRAAEEVFALTQGQSVNVVSSPLPRTLGTANIIAERLGVSFQSIDHESELRCMDFYDAAGAERLWRSFPNAHAVDCAYLTDDRFEAGTVVEKRSAIRHRLFQYLGQLFEKAAHDKLSAVQVHVSHYELLSHLVVGFGFEETLTHCELIKITLSEVTTVGGSLSIDFRGQSRTFEYQMPAELFARQFG